MYYLMIGEFKFELEKEQLDELGYNLELGWKKVDRIGNNPAYQSVNAYTEALDLRATLVLKKQDALDDLMDAAKLKQPLFMVMGYGEIIGKVLISNIKTTKRDFVKNGKAVKKEVSISLLRYYDE